MAAAGGAAALGRGAGRELHSARARAVAPPAAAGARTLTLTPTLTLSLPLPLPLTRTLTLTKALAQLSAAFDRAFRAEEGAPAEEADALCSGACSAARRHARRVVGEALALFPPLQLGCAPDAAGAPDGALGAGAAGAELLSAVERVS